MLLVAKSLKELNFGALMDIYIEGNRENGADLWPEEPAGRQLQLAEEGFRDFLNNDFFRVPNAVCCVWAENGRYVSALRLEPYKDGLLLEALETRPDCRRKGYGEALLRAVRRQFPGRIYSHVHKKNEPSLAIHEKCGYQRILERAAYIDGSVNDRACTLCHPGESE